jgi:hypothetical protein
VTPAALAAQRATRTIPIAFIAVGEPVTSGLGALGTINARCALALARGTAGQRRRERGWDRESPVVKGSVPQPYRDGGGVESPSSSMLIELTPAFLLCDYSGHTNQAGVDRIHGRILTMNDCPRGE